jgi:transposase, IS30 family
LTNTEAPERHRPVRLHPDYLAFVAAELNDRPRKTLHWKTPAEALLELLSNPPIVATTA